jgi:hypothetical protein
VPIAAAAITGASVTASFSAGSALAPATAGTQGGCYGRLALARPENLEALRLVALLLLRGQHRDHRQTVEICLDIDA